MGPSNHGLTLFLWDRHRYRIFSHSQQTAFTAAYKRSSLWPGGVDGKLSGSFAAPPNATASHQTSPRAQHGNDCSPSDLGFWARAVGSIVSAQKGRTKTGLTKIIELF